MLHQRSRSAGSHGGKAAYAARRDFYRVTDIMLMNGTPGVLPEGERSEAKRSAQVWFHSRHRCCLGADASNVCGLITPLFPWHVTAGTHILWVVSHPGIGRVVS